MKKLLLLGGLMLSSFIGFSQIEVLNDVFINDLNSGNSTITKSTICGPDTVTYPMAKATGLSALSINSATSAQALCQYFNAPQAISISGAEFFAYKLDAAGGTSINVNLEVYVAGVDSMPTGVPVASTIVSVDTTFGGGQLSVLRKVGSFTPVTMTVPYCIVVSNLSANGVGMLSNDYNVADGQQEWLSSADLFGTWTRSHGLVVGGSQYDADFIVHPIVTYDLNADFTVSNPCLSAGPTVNFTNNSSPVFFDRMYNQAQFQSIPEFSFSWDYDDGSPIDNIVDGLNVYTVTSSVQYDVMLTDTMYGWNATCAVDTTISIGNLLNAAYTTSVAGSTVDFTEASTSTGPITGYFWDFGDGNTSTLQNPQHVYASSGTYTVCLIASTACATDSTCQSVTVVSCTAPTANFTIGNSDPTFDFTDASSTTGTTTYSWDFGDGSTSTSQNPSHTYGMNGTYTVILIVSDSCGVNTSTQTVVVSGVCTNPVASFTVTDNDPSYDFTNGSTSMGGTFNWDMGDGTTYTTTDASHTYIANGTYTVTLTVTDSCGVDSTTMMVSPATVSLATLAMADAKLFPNPTNGEFIITTSVAMESLEIVEMSGKIVKQFSVEGTQAEIDAKDLADGSYMVRIRQSNGIMLLSRLEIAK